MDNDLVTVMARAIDDDNFEGDPVLLAQAALAALKAANYEIVYVPPKKEGDHG